MPKKLRLFCAIPSIPVINEFSVVIDNNQTVDQLKDKIKEKLAPALDAMMACVLLLYKINAFGDNVKERNEALEKEIRRVEEARKTNNDTVLDPHDTMRDVFQNRIPPAKTTHILVVIPSGEPIDSSDSCACGDVGASLPLRHSSGERAVAWVANSSPRLTTTASSSLVCGLHPLMASGHVLSFLCIN